MDRPDRRATGGAGPVVSALEFRETLGRLAGGVAVVTARGADGEPHGLTATAVSSVSLEPPLVMACIDRQSHTHQAIAASGAFGLNLLRASQGELARRFALDDREKFEGLEVGMAATGAPILAGALAFCDCEVVQSVAAGDHTIFVGRVERTGVGEGDDPPLVYYRGAYAPLEGR